MARKAAQSTPNQLLRQARLERGWTQKDVADRIGAPLDLNVTRWERGTARPSAYYVQRLCELFGKSASELGLVPVQPPPAETEAFHQQASQPASQEQQFWHIPFRRNPFFTGRTHLLQELYTRLSKDQPAALSQLPALTGLGGVGKTQAAVEYAYRYREAYRGVFWVRAASRETLVADFVGLAQILGLPVQDAQNQTVIVTAVKRWLEQHKDWLLILDNADDLPLVLDFLPEQHQGNVLLTTRAQAAGSIARTILVDKMELSEGMRLLLRRAKLLDPDASLDVVSAKTLASAQTIVQVLGGLPLALDQAGAYIEETGCSLSDYLELYTRHRSALLKRPGLAADYPYTVASTWSLSFQQVEQANSLATELLHVCAFLDADVIPEEMLSVGIAAFDTPSQTEPIDPWSLNEAIRVLRRFSLVKRDPEMKLLNIHRLVQVVVRESLDLQKQQQWAAHVVRMVNAVFPEEDFDTWRRCERYLPHAQACASLIEQFGFTFQEATRLLNHAGSYLYKRGFYKQAEAFLRRALAIREQTLGAIHLDVAKSLNDLALLSSHLGRYEQAEMLLERVLAIREQVRGTEHPETARALNELANLHIARGNYEQACQLLDRALSIREQALGSVHLDVAESLNDLAMLSIYQGKHFQAEQLYERALGIREHLLETNHPDIAVSLNGLAWISTSQGKYKQAELLYLRALTILEQVLEPNHRDIAVTLNNLAELYRNWGKHEQARPLCQRALAIQEQILEPNNPYLAASLNNLAAIYHAQSQYEQAEPLYLRALAIREQALGTEHIRVAQSLYGLATLYHVRGGDERALPLYQRALLIYEHALGPEHPDTIAARQRCTELVEG